MIVCRMRPPVITQNRPKYVPPMRKSVIRNAYPIDITYFTGKVITLFTMFYCGLQWDYHRSLREQHEKNNEEEQKKNKHKQTDE